MGLIFVCLHGTAVLDHLVDDMEDGWEGYLGNLDDINMGVLVAIGFMLG